MKKTLLLILFSTSLIINAQQSVAPYPKQGIEMLTKELQEKLSIPPSYYEKEGFTMQVTVDSLSNVKLTSLDPYASFFYKELKKFVENTEWVAGKNNGLENTQMVLIPVKLDKEKLANMEKAHPKEGLNAFYESFVKYIFTTYYRSFKYSSYKVIFEVDEKGKIKISDIQPADGAFRFEVTRFLERKTELWTPAKIDGKPVKSTFTLPIKFQLGSN
ncbi:hypothetical protein SAMN05421741_10191 [Paenimyroides ummariense]|uniref:TonB protein C-terminal n=1 Tax=Paenimyroides ummariense TaxID=913024 RepID=A0A1I4W7E4_9FLAO|nr:hypothetical protein [Paenimyroides ummariense]SFN09140.1 hypothetical protein SAMN05421741_10191 [Paenimyroides ummariense]